jgi:hypothetical protein
MTEKIRKVEPIPDKTKVNPDHISKREDKDAEEFRGKLQREMEERLKNQNKR